MREVQCRLNGRCRGFGLGSVGDEDVVERVEKCGRVWW